MKRLIVNVANRYITSHRRKRKLIFQVWFSPNISCDTVILDLGSEDGTAIFSTLDGLPYSPKNVFIADIDEKAIKRGAERYGFTPILIQEDGKLPFPDGYFDIVYCSSVIEHVTVEKTRAYLIKSQREFEMLSYEHQKNFANEIRRLGKSYFVQTPNRWFLIESHTWFPFVGWLSRPHQIRLISILNKFWVKKTIPDFYLLDRTKLSVLFPDADAIVPEKSMGMTKSWMAIKLAGQRTPI